MDYFSWPFPVYFSAYKMNLWSGHNPPKRKETFIPKTSANDNYASSPCINEWLCISLVFLLCSFENQYTEFG